MSRCKLSLVKSRSRGRPQSYPLGTFKGYLKLFSLVASRLHGMGKAQLLAVASARFFGFIHLLQLIHLFLVTVGAKAMGKINV